MDLIKAIRERRSIRKFQDTKVSREKIIDIIDKAIWAPSGSNTQAWRFIIIDEEAQQKKLKLFAPGLSGNPPVTLAICMDLKEAEKKGGRLGSNELVLYDAGIVCQNIGLLALEHKLGTCIVASFNKKGVQEILGLPNEVKPFLLMSLGYPEIVPSPPVRKKMGEIIYWQRYGKEEEQIE
ncbi:nitroreductase family protein [Natronincola ferrireducens]|uniref:Nitroreductase n=1 Tax=Natronincola ferrireducens TaxID=393762 RepID=A0A1G8XXY4_9FIRM|nr:nitroreductase family protein [Natronincola ferrireducens]SDJ95317.1 Nitroreductase [Natronincola ferrireducens]